MTNPNPSNVTPIESKQPAPAAARFTITAIVDGFPVEISVEGKADNLRAMIDRLKAIGAEPPVAQASTPAQVEQPKKGAPICPVHHTPMKASRKLGTWFCPRQADDGGYCPHKA
jgi:hypothetical protein